MISKGQDWGFAAKASGFVVLAWLFWLLGAIVFTASETEGRAGLLGDFFGGFSALFASLGFVGVVFTLYKQHQDSEAAEERRREDKKDEEAARIEAERLRREEQGRQDRVRTEEQERHGESIKSQERIARIQGYTALLERTAREADETLKAARLFLDFSRKLGGGNAMYAKPEIASNWISIQSLLDPTLPLDLRALEKLHLEAFSENADLFSIRTRLIDLYDLSHLDLKISAGKLLAQIENFKIWIFQAARQTNDA